jgi:putative peptidoglycan lipid II flippase
MESKHAVRGALVNSALIMSSRVLGMVRDMAMLAFFGMSPSLGAFNIAWVVPNMFRRLLGEGAVAAAIQPALARVEEEDGIDTARELFAGFQATVLSALLSLLSIAWVALFFYRGSLIDENALQTNLFYLILLPYMVPICMCALASAPQNLHKHFFWPALAPILLNVCWIAGIFAGSLWASDQGSQLHILCACLLIGGALQWAVQLRGLKNIGWKFQFKWKAKLKSQKSAFVMFIPALIGLAAMQINLLTDQFLVRSLVGPEANTFTFIANRLLQLPIALVGIAAMTGAMPLFARLAAKNDITGMNTNLRRASETTTMLLSCAMVGLMVLALPVVTVLFERGKVTPADSALIAKTLQAYLWVLPIIGLSGLLTRAYQAMHSYKLPMLAALAAIPVNLVLDVAWLPEYGPPAAGWATSASMLAQLLVLLLGLSRHKLSFPLPVAKAWSWSLPIFAALGAAFVLHSQVLPSYEVLNLVFSLMGGAAAAIGAMAITRKDDLAALLLAIRR